jgi:hypothetical protein
MSGSSAIQRLAKEQRARVWDVWRKRPDLPYVDKGAESWHKTIDLGPNA